MKKLKMILTGILMISMLFHLSLFSVFAAEEYTYTVTFYAGNRGTFTGVDGLSVVSTGEVQIDHQGDKVVVGGLKAGDTLSFDLQQGAVRVGDDGKHYVKGVRLSGRDNDTVDRSAFYVDSDEDYVVAYGIKGNMVGYIVRYQDEDGNELAPSRICYGNVGDKPVVAYLYVKNYTPQALALTKTLSSNEAENVFTFVYRPGETEIVSIPGETITVTTAVPGTTTTQTIVVPGTNTAANAGTASNGTGSAGTAQTPGTDGNAAPGADAGTGTESETQAGTEAEVGENTEDKEEVSDTQEMIDLDEDETPLAEESADRNPTDGKKVLLFAAGIAIALIVLVILLRKRLRR